MSKSDKTITEKMTELSDLVAWFESEDFSLEVALDKFKLAENLAKEIETDLSSYKNEINVLKKKFDQE